MTIGAKIRELRNAAEMTQAELAKRVGVKMSRISNIEIGKVDRVKELDKFAEVLGVSLAELQQIAVSEALKAQRNAKKNTRAATGSLNNASEPIIDQIIENKNDEIKELREQLFNASRNIRAQENDLISTIKTLTHILARTGSMPSINND